MIVRTPYLVIPAALMQMACSSIPQTVSVTSTETSFVSNGTPAIFSFDDVNHQVTVSRDGGGSVTIDLDPDWTTPANLAAYNTIEASKVVRASTGSGAGTAVVYIWEDEVSEVLFSRTGDTTYTLDGEAVFAGVYGGVIEVPGGNPDAAVPFVSGTASLTLDFANGLVSGSITNRTAESVGATIDFEDVIMASATLVDGAFSGTTAGGARITTGYSADAGTYGGLLVGADGTEAVGGITILFRFDGAAQGTEYGVFTVAE